MVNLFSQNISLNLFFILFYFFIFYFFKYVHVLLCCSAPNEMSNSRPLMFCKLMNFHSDSLVRFGYLSKQIERRPHRSLIFHSRFLWLKAGRSSEVRWVVGSILHGVDPLSYFSFQPVLHDWCNKGRGMYYPVCGMVHIKEPLMLIDKSSLCGGSGFPFSLSEWSLTICLTPYNRR